MRLAIGRPRIGQPVGAPHAGADLPVGLVVGAERHRADARHAKRREPFAAAAPRVHTHRSPSRRKVTRVPSGESATSDTSSPTGSRSGTAPPSGRDAEEMARDARPAARRRASTAVRWRRRGRAPRPGPASAAVESPDGGSGAGSVRCEVGHAPQARAVGVHHPHVAIRPAGVVPQKRQAGAVGRPRDAGRGRADEAWQRGHALHGERGTGAGRTTAAGHAAATTSQHDDATGRRASCALTITRCRPRSAPPARVTTSPAHRPRPSARLPAMRPALAACSPPARSRRCWPPRRRPPTRSTTSRARSGRGAPPRSPRRATTSRASIGPTGWLPDWSAAAVAARRATLAELTAAPRAPSTRRPGPCRARSTTG